MPHRLAAGIAASVAAVSVWSSTGQSRSTAFSRSDTAAACTVRPQASAVLVRLAAHLPAPIACGTNGGRAHRHIPALVLAQFPHTAIELNGRVYLDMIREASPPTPGSGHAGSP